jgi:hypothetical protein
MIQMMKCVLCHPTLLMYHCHVLVVTLAIAKGYYNITLSMVAHL